MAERDPVERLLGVPDDRVGSPLGLARSIESGLSVTVVERLAKLVAPNDKRFKYRLVPKATLERKRRERTRLSLEEGNRIARIAKIYEFARTIYGDESKVDAFLTRPHMMLEGKAPIDVALATGPGADAVTNLLGRAAYGGGV